MTEGAASGRRRHRDDTGTLPDWARWPEDATDLSIGVEEEVMLLNPGNWSPAQRIDTVMPVLSEQLAARVTPETHRSALELRTDKHTCVRDAAEELAGLRAELVEHLEPLGLNACSTGVHPFATWSETVVTDFERQRSIYDSLRELARREPTFALHVHVGVSSPERAIRLLNRLRFHLPVLLAVSVNSPFWQGRDSGLCSARTPLFQAFPRVGIPRAFAGYDDWIDAVARIIDAGVFSDPSFLWWDVRLSPTLGTVEVRIMDSQITVPDTAALVALVQSVARLELCVEGPEPADTIEVLQENRFIALRDGSRAELIRDDTTVPVLDLLGRLVERCRPHAEDLGCSDELDDVERLADDTGAMRQRAAARSGRGLRGVVGRLCDQFLAGIGDDPTVEQWSAESAREQAEHPADRVEDGEDGEGRWTEEAANEPQGAAIGEDDEAGKSVRDEAEARVRAGEGEQS